MFGISFCSVELSLRKALEHVEPEILKRCLYCIVKDPSGYPKGNLASAEKGFVHFTGSCRLENPFFPPCDAITVSFPFLPPLKIA